MGYYDRYLKFRTDGRIKIVPYINISKSDEDLYIQFDKNTMRMDMLSYKYYGNPDYAWLILQANPEYGSLEYFIPDGVIIRIPYPLSSAIIRYEDGIKEYNIENN